MGEIPIITTVSGASGVGIMASLSEEQAELVRDLIEALPSMDPGVVALIGREARSVLEEEQGQRATRR